MNEILVRKPKRKDAKYTHEWEILSASATEIARSEMFAEFTDNFTVLLLKNEKPGNGYLNLSPLLIDTRAFLRAEKSYQPNIFPDLYLYSKCSKNFKPHYSGINAPDKFNLESLPNYGELVMEIKEIF